MRLVLPHERIDDLGGGYRIIQNPACFCFGIDAVLLSSFVKAGKGETGLDIGTGTGIIPVLLAKKTAAASIKAIELQDDMADMAGRSVLLNSLSDRITVMRGDARDGTVTEAGRYDFITSNPPYTQDGSGLKNKTEALTLSRHEQSLDLDCLLAVCYRALKFRGRLYLIYRANRLVDLICALRSHRLEPKTMRQIQSRQNSAPKLVLVEAVRNGGAFLTNMPPLVIYGGDGKYTDEVRAMYDY